MQESRAARTRQRFSSPRNQLPSIPTMKTRGTTSAEAAAEAAALHSKHGASLVSWGLISIQFLVFSALMNQANAKCKGCCKQTGLDCIGACMKGTLLWGGWCSPLWSWRSQLLCHSWGLGALLRGAMLLEWSCPAPQPSSTHVAVGHRDDGTLLSSCAASYRALTLA